MVPLTASGKAEIEHIVDVDETVEGEDEGTDSEDYSDDAEDGSENEDEEEYEDIDIEEEGVYAGGRSIIVKADSGKGSTIVDRPGLVLTHLLCCATCAVLTCAADVTLGTLTDRYEDCVATLTEMLAEQQQQQEGVEAVNSNGSLAAHKIPGPGVNRVVHWGIGEIGMKDVNMAKAADGTGFSPPT